ncbi:hypothetical protein CCR97_29920 [Rhodoplanes elegans]|uniref:DUF1902 domain-containing protein n=1 Tax=Rhodoplanes elegans TaxID=29408 RepID=A0A327KP76_9BRAD|nr:DUF1902 domain-containing protein [Rhodoplanes elegans]MBK5962376.1 hypothetical protein [Rhodoplanes elegans]RAI39165.1 hypothetical protein CH338_10300 [Rhodoplanes elegans]
MTDAVTPAPSFTVTATWDADAGVFYSQSDVPGLHIEAETFDAFLELVRDLAPEMIADNRPDIEGPYSVQVVARRELILPAA